MNAPASAAGGWPAYRRGHRKPAAKGPGSQRGFGATWWGAAWVGALQGQARLDPNRLPRGRSYARSGAVGELSVAPGGVRAPVQGSPARPYDVQVKVRQFDKGEWDRLLDIVAAQVGHTAALLDGELPPEILEDVKAAGLALLPGPGDLQPHCSCPDWANPCKHAAAVCFLVADVLDSDPFALLLLRGRDRDAILSSLRTRRGGASVEAEHQPDLDRGMPARLAYAATDRPALPLPSLPPQRPGRPATLGATLPSTALPPAAGIDGQSLSALAADAALRAHQMLHGLGDGGLSLDRDEDLARRASELIISPESGGTSPGTHGTSPEVHRNAPGTHETSPEFEALARRAGVPGRDLRRRALAWKYGGPDGLTVLAELWQPDRDDLAEGRRALGTGTRAKDNRLTQDARQLRLGADGRWYPYFRTGGSWEPAGPPSFDPVEANAADAADAANG